MWASLKRCIPPSSTRINKTVAGLQFKQRETNAGDFVMGVREEVREEVRAQKGLGINPGVSTTGSHCHPRLEGQQR